MSLLCHGCGHRQSLPQSFVVVVVFSLRLNLNSTSSFAVINSLNSVSFLQTVSENASIRDRVEFLQEASVMK